MTSRATELFDEAMRLDAGDRKVLTDLLIEALDHEEEEDEDPGAAWAAEIKRRVQELRSGLVETVTWEKLQERLSAQLSARKTS